MQHCLSFPPRQVRPVLVLAPGPRPTGDAMRLLERALSESGLARLSPRIVERVNPRDRLVIAFGAEAATMLLRRPVGLNLERGRLRPIEGRQLLVTEHPEVILRQSDAVARGREYRRLVSDLQQAVPMPRSLAA
jgi:hypothetical protein